MLHHGFPSSDRFQQTPVSPKVMHEPGGRHALVRGLRKVSFNCIVSASYAESSSVSYQDYL